MAELPSLVRCLLVDGRSGKSSVTTATSRGIPRPSPLRCNDRFPPTSDSSFLLLSGTLSRSAAVLRLRPFIAAALPVRHDLGARLAVTGDHSTNALGGPSCNFVE